MHRVTEIIVGSTQTEETYWHDGEQYGSWNASYSFSVHGVYLPGPGGNADHVQGEETRITVPGDVIEGQEVYALVMRWGSGDSFGSDTGRGEVVWVFTDQLTAAQAIMEFQAKKDEYIITIYLEDGNEVRLTNPAAGYFERLENLYIETFNVV